MSIESASTLRILSRVYPSWLPKAMASTEPKILPTLHHISTASQPLPPVRVPESFQSIEPYNKASRSILIHNSSYQNLLQQDRMHHARQMRCFSTTPISPPDGHVRQQRKSTWIAPTDVSNRPVAIVGAGVIGRRLAALWASTGRPVNLYDNSSQAVDSARSYIADSLSSFCAENNTHPGAVHFPNSLQDTVQNAWMVIEAVPEDIELKISLIGRLDRLTSTSCIIATTSSSFRSRELVSEVSNRARVLNTLYYIPPQNRSVELMSCGYTDHYLPAFLMRQMESVNLRPKLVWTESTGLILPRIWAAIKRECLMELAEGASTPADIDELFRDFFGARKGPCEKMDEVGLDTVAAVEKKFLDDDERRVYGGRKARHLKWLEEVYLNKGKLGDKSGEGLMREPRRQGQWGGRKGGEGDAGEIWKGHAIDLSGV